MKELSLNVLDIAQNSYKAGASHVEIRLEQAGNRLAVSIRDDGCGMDADFLKNVTDPFTTTRTTRKVGMGLPLFKLAAEQTGGTLSIKSKRADASDPSHGTTVSAVFYTDHMDCAPLGDIASTVVTLIQGNPDVELTFTRVVDGVELVISTREMREMLGPDVPINAPEVLAWVKDSISE